MAQDRFDHDPTVEKLRAITADPALGERVTELFIASLATGVRRAMTPIMAYHSSRNLPDHTWERFDFAAHNQRYDDEESIPCAVCGIPKRQSWDRPWYIQDFTVAGRCSIPPSGSHLIDLEDVGNIDLAYRPEHVETLRALLKIVDSIPVNLSTTDLEKRISAAKVLPKSNLAARLWCLRILAQLGVITNARVPGYSGALHFYGFVETLEAEEDAFAHMPHRADPVWPLSAGRGQPAVDWSIAARVFPQLDAAG